MSCMVHPDIYSSFGMKWWKIYAVAWSNFFASGFTLNKWLAAIVLAAPFMSIGSSVRNLSKYWYMLTFTLFWMCNPKPFQGIQYFTTYRSDVLWCHPRLSFWHAIFLGHPYVRWLYIACQLFSCWPCICHMGWTWIPILAECLTKASKIVVPHTI